MQTVHAPGNLNIFVHVELKKWQRNSNVADKNSIDHLPGFGFRQHINLLLEVGHHLHVLLLEDMGGLLRLQMHLIDQLAQLGQLDVTVAVQHELKDASQGVITLAQRRQCPSNASYLVLGTTLSLLKTLGHGDDLDTQVSLLALNLETLHRQTMGRRWVNVRLQMAQFNVASTCVVGPLKRFKVEHDLQMMLARSVQ